ncbi:MAG: 3-dehydroquinate synthase [Betaproteobacteria bacterium]|nr:3-dehydroquinate synthase [Betaproteobacteria bacterium]
MNVHGPVPNWNALESLLENWFSLQLNRTSALSFDSTIHSWDTGLLAAALFKRGARELHCIKSGEIRSVTQPGLQHKPAQHTTETTVYNKFEELWANLVFSAPGTAVLCDKNFLRCHPQVEDQLRRARVPLVQMDCTEETKTLHTAREIFSAIPASTQHIVIMGGGICCDLGGLVGGLLGCKIRLVPTTLLAAVDAGLGGKTGANHARAGKNQIGLFVTLQSVDVVTEFLSTLQPSQVREGSAEILKHAFLEGSFTRWLPALNELQLQASSSAVKWANFRELLLNNLNFKKRITQIDPLEKNIRALLNYGHTVAHLLESLFASAQSNKLNTPLSHGCAVALGQLCFLEIGWASSAPEGYHNALVQLLQNEGIVYPLKELDTISVTARKLLLQDKKNTDATDFGLVRCITPQYGCLANLEAIDESQLGSLVAENTALIHVDELLRELKNAGLFS